MHRRIAFFVCGSAVETMTQCAKTTEQGGSNPFKKRKSVLVLCLLRFAWLKTLQIYRFNAGPFPSLL
jgi:hypothetical protein